MARHDDPEALAALVAHLPDPLLIGLDVDGVLAPISRHADDALLLDGIDRSLGLLAATDRVHVAVVSGRSLADLLRFGFPGAVTVVGSHGMETDLDSVDLDPVESRRMTTLGSLAQHAADAAGPGAWVESKPASVAVHVREADTDRAHRALEALATAVDQVAGASSIAGSEVLELFTRTASKGDAMHSLRRRFDASAAVFVGDDVTDEAAFASLEPHDVRIKVGDAPTIAEHRLADPQAVRSWLDALCAVVG